MFVLAHALPQSIGAVPLTVVLTVVIALFLAVGARSTTRAAALVGVRGGRDPAVADGRHDPPASVPDDARPAAGTPSVGHLVGVVGLLAVAVLATAGSPDAATNLTDAVVLQVLWGLVGISSALLGGWWPRVDPLRGVAGALAAATGHPSTTPPHPGVTRAVLVGSLLVWAWAQMLVSPTVAGFQALLLGYVVVHVGGAARHGTAWLDRAEPLTALSTTMGLLRPGGGGPLARLTAMPDDDRVHWIAGVLIGWSLTDLVVETEWWHDTGGEALGLVVLLAATIGTALLIRAAAGRFRLGPAFVAVAGGWVLAHYLSVLLIDGQGIPIWLSDPFATGADLLGRRGDLVDPEPLPTALMAVLQSVPFVLGHLAGVVVAQRRAAAVVTSVERVGQATFFSRALIGVLLVTGTWLQLGGH